MSSRVLAGVVLLLVCTPCLASPGDEIRLTDGKILTGEITGVNRDGHIVMNVPWCESPLHVRRDSVVRIDLAPSQQEGSPDILVGIAESGFSVEGVFIAGDDRGVTIEEADGSKVTFSYNELSYISLARQEKVLYHGYAGNWNLDPWKGNKRFWKVRGGALERRALTEYDEDEIRLPIPDAHTRLSIRLRFEKARGGSILLGKHKGDKDKGIQMYLDSESYEMPGFVDVNFCGENANQSLPWPIPNTDLDFTIDYIGKSVELRLGGTLLARHQVADDFHPALGFMECNFRIREIQVRTGRKYLIPPRAQKDGTCTLHLANGDTISGKGLRLSPKHVSIKALGTTLKTSTDKISSITFPAERREYPLLRKGSVELTTADGGLFVGELKSIGNDLVCLTDEGGRSHAFQRSSRVSMLFCRDSDMTTPEKTLQGFVKAVNARKFDIASSFLLLSEEDLFTDLEEEIKDGAKFNISMSLAGQSSSICRRVNYKYKVLYAGDDQWDEEESQTDAFFLRIDGKWYMVISDLY